MHGQTAREIDAAAAAWAARADRGLSAAEERELDAWLAGDVRRVGAYGKAQAIALHSERARALAPNYDPAKFQPPAPSRRRMLVAGGGAIAAGVAALGVGVTLEGRGARYSTRRGEVRVVPLEDGSVISLNTASAVTVSYTRGRRLIQLTEGEALFDVAKDRNRPFVVVADDTEVTAVGTSFTVRRLASGPVLVLVREGVVQVDRRAGPERWPVRVAANTRVVAPAGPERLQAVALPADDIGRELAWRAGRIAFEGETLSEAAEQFARYSETRIVIDDESIAREEITGLFQANDPVGFAQAVATSLDLHADVGAGQVRLRR